jgi:hypothetical protein
MAESASDVAPSWGARQQAERIGRPRTALVHDIQPADQRILASARPDLFDATRCLNLQRLAGNAAVSSLLCPPNPPFAGPAGKQVEGGESDPVEDGLPATNGHDAGADAGGGGGTKSAPTAKSAGVDSFTVTWAKNSSAGPGVAQLRLDYKAKFKKDASHDPALAEFRQNAGDKWEIIAGPHKGAKHDHPLADDNYSRADDLAGNKITDCDFSSNDNPGWDSWIDKDDVLDYNFTAEQMIIDTSQSNKVIAKRGPHTGGIKGKHPRTYSGVPTTLS